MKQDAIDALRVIRDDLSRPRHEEALASTSPCCSSSPSAACAVRRARRCRANGSIASARLPAVPRRAADARGRLRGRGGSAARAPLRARTRHSTSRSRSRRAGPATREGRARGDARDRQRLRPAHPAAAAPARDRRRRGSSGAASRPGPDTLGRWWELLRPDRPEPAERFAPGHPRGASCARSSPTWSGISVNLEEVGRIANARRRRGREGGRREARCARAAAARPARRRPRAARGLSRASRRR